jgi:predicted dehydrogenase
VLPRIEDGEPLKNEAEHFIQCIREGKRPYSDGRSGLEVVEVLEAACRSIKEGGVPIPVNGVPSSL